MLAAAGCQELDPYLDLGRGQLQIGRKNPIEAEITLASVLERFPDHPLAEEWLALAKVGLGKRDEGLELLRKSVERNSDRPESSFNLGRVLAGYGEPEEALGHLERAIAAWPVFVPAWFYLGGVLAALERPGGAADAYRRALELEPTHGRAYLALGETLMEQGVRQEVLRYWLHAIEVLESAQPIEEALAAAE